MNFDPAPRPIGAAPQPEDTPAINSALSEPAEEIVARSGAGSDSNPQVARELSLPPVLCQRCGKTVASGLAVCPYCEARLRTASVDWSQTKLTRTSRAVVSQHHAETATAVSRLLLFYVMLLVTSLVGHFVLEAMSKELQSNERVASSTVAFTVLFEVVDTLIVLIALTKMPRPPRIGPTSTFYRNLGFIAAPFILAIVMGLNFGYHHLLENYVQYPSWIHSRHHFPIAWAIVLVCIQPGIVEELFFRYLALGTLSRVMGIVAAICVSSLMFGLAHCFVLLSIPILTVVGIGLGLIRVWSGSIILPMLLHAVHNATVIYLEWYK